MTRRASRRRHGQAEWTEQDIGRDDCGGIAANAVAMGAAAGRCEADSRPRSVAPPARRARCGIRAKLEALIAEEPESPRIPAIERERDNLHALQDFALPIIDNSPAGPRAIAGRDGSIAPARARAEVLRRPTRVLRVLAELAPIGEIGPVTLREVREVLTERLSLLDVEPPTRRYGRMFVGSPHQARGRAFHVVFVPGLAERLFPRRPHEDPLLLDIGASRSMPASPCRRRAAPASACCCNWPPARRRSGSTSHFPVSSSGESRPRVPSFYALDVVRAVTGTIPWHDDAGQQGRGGARARDSRGPRRRTPREAVDELEHDLSVLARSSGQKGGAATGMRTTC